MRKPGSERIDHSMRVKFNPLALLLDSSLEGEFDLVQRIIYEVRNVVSFASVSAMLINYHSIKDMWIKISKRSHCISVFADFKMKLLLSLSCNFSITGGGSQSAQ